MSARLSGIRLLSSAPRGTRSRRSARDHRHRPREPGSGQKAEEDTKKMKADLKFTKIEDVDTEIKRLEMKQSTTTMNIKEEKELIKAIESLKAKRKQVEKLAAKLAQVSGAKAADAGSSEDINAKLDQKTAQLNEVRDRYTAQMDKLKAVEAKFGNQNDDWDNYKKQRDALSKEIDALIKERNAIRAEWKKDHDAWYKYTQEVRRIKKIKYEKEEKERQAEYEAMKKARKKRRRRKAVGGGDRALRLPRRIPRESSQRRPQGLQDR